MIPVCEPALGEAELANVITCIKENAISGTSGQFIEQFEREFSQYCGRKHGIATTSGTTALHLAIASLGLGEGDEVIVPTFTNAASAFCVIYNRATPVFVDSEPQTWNIDPTRIEEKITNNTKAILPVHIYGHSCDMDPIMKIADKYRLYVVEDAAEAHGAEYKGKKAGGLGDIGCFSFYANKIITTGEGGLIVTDNDKIAEQARLLRNLAFSKKRRFLHEHVGFNYRMTNIEAAIGVAQLQKIDEFIQKKRVMAGLYNLLLKNTPAVTLPPEKHWAKNVYWMYSILIEDEFGMGRDEVMARLADRGIDTRAMFIPMNQQPVFREMGLCEDGCCPVADELSRKGLYLPSGVGLTKEQIEYVAGVIKEISHKAT